MKKNKAKPLKCWTVKTGYGYVYRSHIWDSRQGAILSFNEQAIKPEGLFENIKGLKAVKVTITEGWPK